MFVFRRTRKEQSVLHNLTPLRPFKSFLDILTFEVDGYSYVLIAATEELRSLVTSELIPQLRLHRYVFDAVGRLRVNTAALKCCTRSESCYGSFGHRGLPCYGMVLTT